MILHQTTPERRTIMYVGSNHRSSLQQMCVSSSRGPMFQKRVLCISSLSFLNNHTRAFIAVIISIIIGITILALIFGRAWISACAAYFLVCATLDQYLDQFCVPTSSSMLHMIPITPTMPPVEYIILLPSTYCWATTVNILWTTQPGVGFAQALDIRGLRNRVPLLLQCLNQSRKLLIDVIAVEELREILPLVRRTWSKLYMHIVVLY